MEELGRGYEIIVRRPDEDRNLSHCRPGTQGSETVSSKWCFDYKTDKEGKITKFKPRLVARGFTQIRDVDYTYSSSPCPSLASIKLVLAVANEKGLPLRLFDAVQAYIRASLDEEVYMKIPGDCGEQSKRTAKLGKAIYGLKQSGRKRVICVQIS